MTAGQVEQNLRTEPSNKEKLEISKLICKIVIKNKDGLNEKWLRKNIEMWKGEDTELLHRITLVSRPIKFLRSNSFIKHIFFTTNPLLWNSHRHSRKAGKGWEKITEIRIRKKTKG